MRLEVSALLGELYVQLTYEELSLGYIAWGELIKDLKREIDREHLVYDFIEKVWTIKGIDNHAMFYYIFDRWQRRQDDIRKDQAEISGTGDLSGSIAPGQYSPDER